MRKSIVIVSCMFGALLCSCASNSDITRLEDEIADVRSQSELAGLSLFGPKIGKNG